MALRDARPCPTAPASSTTSINMAIDWSKIDKKSLALLVGMCILFNWVNGKLQTRGATGTGWETGRSSSSEAGDAMPC